MRNVLSSEPRHSKVECPIQLSQCPCALAHYPDQLHVAQVVGGHADTARNANGNVAEQFRFVQLRRPVLFTFVLGENDDCGEIGFDGRTILESALSPFLVR